MVAGVVVADDVTEDVAVSVVNVNEFDVMDVGARSVVTVVSSIEVVGNKSG